LLIYDLFIVTHLGRVKGKARGEDFHFHFKMKHAFSFGKILHPDGKT